MPSPCSPSWKLWIGWSGPLPRSLGGKWPCPLLPLKCAKHCNGVQNNPSGVSDTAFKPFNCSFGYIATEMTNNTIDSWESTEGSSILHPVSKKLSINHKPQIMLMIWKQVNIFLLDSHKRGRSAQVTSSSMLSQESSKLKAEK